MHRTHGTAVRAPAATGAVPKTRWHLRGRGTTVLRAQAPVEVADVATSTGPASGSGCPVLSALQAPPPYEMNPLQDLWLASTDPTEHRMRSQNGKPVSSARYMGVLPAVWLGAMGPLKDVLAHESAGRLTTGWPKSTHLLLGSESLTLVKDPEHHRFLRKVMLGAMSAEAVEAYLPEIYDICVERLERWAEECETHGRTVPALSGLKAMTIKVIASVVMDIQLDEQELKAVGDDFNIWIKPLFSMNAHDVWPLPFYFAMRARERLVVRIEARLTQLRQELASGRSSRRVGSTLHRLLTEKDENGQGLTHKQVVDNLLTTLFAGHDTTSSYLSALMFELATRPEVLARVRAEQQQVVARHGPRMTPAALRDMKYTQAVLSEVFRVKNLVNVAPRVAKEDIAVGGYKIEAGQRILLHFGYMMTTDPRWPADGDPASNPLHPANFNPDRFMTPEGAKQGQQLPFGTGNRVCAGMSLAQAETKVFLATLARGYTFVADTNTTWSQRPILRPDNGLPVYVTRLPPALRVA